MIPKICIANPKGGSGKTSCAVNLSSALSLQDKRVLLCDLDPQCSATVALGLRPADDAHSLAGVLISKNDPRDCIVSLSPTLDVIAANSDLTVVPVALYTQDDAHLRLKKALEEIESNYDVIIIDTPASLSILNINAICACNKLLVPLCCDSFAIDSLSMLLTLCKRLQDEHKSSIELLGLLRTFFDDKSHLVSYISAELQAQFQDKVFESVISFNSRISEAQASGQSLLAYDRSSIAATQYISLGAEVLNRLYSQSKYSAWVLHLGQQSFLLSLLLKSLSPERVLKNK